MVKKHVIKPYITLKESFKNHKFIKMENDESIIIEFKRNKVRKMNDYFKEDEYWKGRTDKSLEDDIWIEDYKEFFDKKGKCLDLGCGIGQYSKILMEYGYDVTSADISRLALNKVKEFNKNVIQIDMREKLPFKNEEFDLVFASLSIHYFSDSDTKKLITEIRRILKKGGLFIGSVKEIKELHKIKDTAKELEYHFYLNKNKYIRLFDVKDLENYLDIFNVVKIDERESIRFNNKKNYLIFIVKK